MILVMNLSEDEHELLRRSLDETQSTGTEDEKAEKGPIEKEFLPLGFQPKEWDVICHNGKEPKSHVGNRRFKVIVQNYLSSYMKANTRSLKSAVITDIISVIRSKSTQNGGFVRYDDVAKRWYEVGDKVARDKVGHTLREAMKALELESTTTEPSSHGEAAVVSMELGVPSSAPLVPIGNPSSSPATADAIVLQPDPIRSQGSGGSSNLGSISAGSQSHKGEETPVAKNLVDWFESDSMDES